MSHADAHDDGTNSITSRTDACFKRGLLHVAQYLTGLMVKVQCIVNSRDILVKLSVNDHKFSYHIFTHPTT